MRIGVMTGGGDCPGLNAVIRAVTLTLQNANVGAKVFGIEDSFEGLSFAEPHVIELNDKIVNSHYRLGGTFLGTKNNANPMADASLKDRILTGYKKMDLDAIVTIGGDGSMTIANEFVGEGLKFVGVPKTIDNDIVGCERSFGFDTAVNTVASAIENIENTAKSHKRVIFVETMGRHAGWLALESAIAGGARICLLPEFEIDLDALAQQIERVYKEDKYAVVVVGEGSRIKNESLIIEAGATNSFSGVKLGGIAKHLEQALKDKVPCELRSIQLGHIQRGGNPTAFDRILSSRYGHYAAVMVLEGCFGKMVRLDKGTLSQIDLQEVAGKQRLISKHNDVYLAAQDLGIFIH